LQVRQRSIERFAAWIDDDGPLGAQPIEVAAHRLAHAPLDAVPRHGFAECAGNGESDVRSRCLGLAEAERREQRAGIAGSLLIDLSEILRSKEADTFRKTSDGTLPLGADGEFFPAAGPPARQHRAAILGLHTAAKSMRLRTAPPIRLKGTFWHLA